MPPNAPLAESGIGRQRVKTPKRVFLGAIHSKMKTFSPDSMPIFTLETAAGVNLAADAPPSGAPTSRPTARTLITELGAGRDVAFLTLGDPLTYSTFGYTLMPPHYLTLIIAKRPAGNESA